MLRVGLVIYGSLETLSGGYLYDRMLVEHMRRHGDSVEIISQPWRSYARRLGDNLSAAFLEHLSAGKYDLLLQDELNHPSLFLLNNRLRQDARMPLISIVHHLRSSEQRSAWQNLVYRWVENHYLRGVDGFIFNSRTTRNEVVKSYCAPFIRPYVVAYPGGDRFDATILPDEIDRRAAEPGPLRILFIGNWIPRKGLLTLLEAMERVPPGLCTLTIVGEPRADTRYAHRVRHRIEQAGLTDRVIVCGRLSEPALADTLRRSHVLAVPSTYEGFGIVYLEGMAFGLPVIATQLGAASELIQDRENGYILPPADPASLAQVFLRLANDRRVLAGMGRSALQRYQAYPTWEQSMQKIRAFLVEQMSKYGKGNS